MLQVMINLVLQTRGLEAVPTPSDLKAVLTTDDGPWREETRRCADHFVQKLQSVYSEYAAVPSLSRP
jgi:hypothetical protein